MIKGQFPIGIFDSGLGGLTVVRETHQILPNESILYFGDCARVPYGIKSDKTVRRFSQEIAEFLIARGVKAIVVACNTASSVALEDLRSHYDIPILGVVNPGAIAALGMTKNNIIGAIGTVSTIESKAYAKTISKMNPKTTFYSRACPLLVPLAEEGWLEHPLTYKILEIYLKPFIDENIDTLILGCTHYPLFKTAIRKLLPATIQIVDSAVATAQVLKNTLLKHSLLNLSNQSECRYFVTDLPKRFQEIGERFLGSPIDPVEVISLEK